MKTARVLDFETTGFPPNASVVEIGYTDVTLMGSGSVLHWPTSYIVRPEHPIEIDAMAVHHITPQMVQKHAEADCAWALSELAKAQVDVWVAHNYKFEIQFFNPLNSVWIDTLKVARKLAPQLKHHTVSHLIYALDLYKGMDPKLFQPLHRAGPDTYATAHILKWALGQMSIQEMIDLTNTFNPEDDLQKTCYLPKHKGKPWSEVPMDYLMFIRSWEDFDKKDERFRKTILYWIEIRLAEVKARHSRPPSASSPRIAPLGDGRPVDQDSQIPQTDPGADPLGR